MGNIIILNGSPRAPKSNSKRYAEIFAAYCSNKPDYFAISKTNHQELRSRMASYTDLLLVFPLYADALPVGLLGFLKFLEENPPEKKPVISVFINCGFFEYEQNEIAIEMLRLFCKRNGYSMGSILMLGSGEAILDTPFKYVVKRAAKKLVKSIERMDYKEMHATMPLTKKLFVMASTVYWTLYGRKFGITKTQMATPVIE